MCRGRVPPVPALAEGGAAGGAPTMPFAGPPRALRRGGPNRPGSRLAAIGRPLRIGQDSVRDRRAS